MRQKWNFNCCLYAGVACTRELLVREKIRYIGEGLILEAELNLEKIRYYNKYNTVEPRYKNIIRHLQKCSYTEVFLILKFVKSEHNRPNNLFICIIL
jgi:hypothetical protein